MKLQRTFICIAGVFFAVGFGASQAAAGTGDGICSGGAGLMQIEINALRAGGKNINAGPNQTADVTSKARLLKGTAQPDTTLETTMKVQVFDGNELLPGGAETFPISLVVGKGGKGDKLTVDVGKCDTGNLTFVATFFGFDADTDLCTQERSITKACK